MTMVTVRFFAAARAAVGERTVTIDATTIGAILDRFDDPVVARCSFLVNGVATRDSATVLVAGDEVDVLPPFAGG
jgi:molybdopterin synthase sulfur carrier subunit